MLHAEGWKPECGLGLTHYQAVGGIYGKIGDQWYVNGIHHDRNLIGIFTTRSKVSPARITDGMSKMLAFGEAPGSIGNGIDDESTTYSGFVLGYAWIGSTTLPTIFGLDATTQNNYPNPGAVYDTFWSCFGSLHLGSIVPFVYADGSVHSVRKDIEQSIFVALSTIRGGELINGGMP